MQIETIMNALISAIVLGKANYYTEQDEDIAIRRFRQYVAFRARIIRMDREKDARIQEMQDIYTLERILNDTDNG